MRELKSSDIAVIIPAYNAQKYINCAINSVKDQTLGNDARIIVIDDGSTDDTVNIAKENGAKVLTQKHAFAAAARNTGILQSKSDYLYFLDADDIMADNTFEIYKKLLLENEEIEAVFSRAEDFISEELTDEEKATLIPRNEPYSGVFAGATFIKRDAFIKVGYFNESLTSGEGLEWLMRIRKSCIKSLSIDDVTVKRRLHLTNTGRINKVDEAQNFARILRARINANKT